MKSSLCGLVLLMVGMCYGLEIPLREWLSTDPNLRKTVTTYMTFDGNRAIFHPGKESLDFFHPGPILAKEGNIVTVSMKVSGTGKAWIGLYTFADQNYTHCEGNQDISFIAAERPLKRQFRFDMKGADIRAVRPHLIVTAGSKITIENFEVGIQEKAEHPPLNPIAPEAKLFKEPISKARWIWSPFDTRFSYFRTTRMQDAYFRLAFRLDQPVKKAELLVGFCLPGKVYINGKLIPTTPFPQPNTQLRADKYIIGEALKIGENVLAIECVNQTEDKSCGLIFLGEIELADGKKVLLASDQNVKTRKDAPIAGWLQSGFDASSWAPAMEMGDASTGRWMNMGYPIRYFTTDAEKKAYYEGLLAAEKLSSELEKKLAEEPATQAAITWRNGLPDIDVNGQKFLPVRRIGLHFAAPYDGYDFVYKTAGIGLDLLEISVGDAYASSSYWKASGKYDFSSMNMEIARLLALNPNAHFFVDLYFAAMTQWCKDHPDEVIQYATGPIDPNSDEMTGRPLRPSPASLRFREEMCRILKSLSEYIASRPWGKRVIGIKIDYGVYGEWQYYGSNQNMPDTGKAMTAAFRKFLRNKYQTDDALRKAWNKPAAAIDTALPPTASDRWGEHHFLRNPAVSRYIMDYYDCMQNEMADLMIIAGKTVKQYLPGRLCGAYYSYHTRPNTPEGMKIMEEKILASGAIDFFMAPNDYNNETRGIGGTGETRVRSSIMQRFGKLGILEADIRTHISETGEQCIQLKNEEETTAVMRRDFCNTIFDKSGIQLHQFGGEGPYRGGPDWFNSPGIIAEIKKDLAVLKVVREIPNMQWKQDIVVVGNNSEFAHHGYPVQDLQNNDYFVWWQRWALYSSGYAFDYLDIKDYFLSKEKYKIVVFLEPFTFSTSERKELLAKLRNSGATVIWLYAPGFVTENGFSEKAMEELTGIKLTAKFDKLPMKINLPDGSLIQVTNNYVNPPQAHKESPRIACEDKNAAVKGRYDDGTVGFAEKNNPAGFRSVFIGVPVSSPYIWANIFREFGGHAYVEPKVIVRANSRLVMVHVGAAGVYKVSLPKKTKLVTDLYANEIIARNTDHVELVADTPFTWLLKLN